MVQEELQKHNSAEIWHTKLVTAHAALRGTGRGGLDQRRSAPGRSNANDDGIVIITETY